MNRKKAYEFMIPKGYASVMFFQDEQTMKECCEKWNLEPVVNDEETRKDFPHLFAALRKGERFSLFPD